MPHSKWICRAVYQLISLIGTRMCMFRSLRYLSNFCLMRLSQADAFLPKLSCNLVLFCFVFYPAVLFFLPSSPACSFCLSAGDVCSACQWAFTRVPCLLLRGPLCSSANPLFKCTQQRRAVSVIFVFFFNHFLVMVFDFCFLDLARFSHWNMYSTKATTWHNCLEFKQWYKKSSLIPKQDKIRRWVPERWQINVVRCEIVVISATQAMSVVKREA